MATIKGIALAPITGLSLASSSTTTLSMRPRFNSSFLTNTNGLRTLKISRMPQIRCNGYRGGALGTQMNLFYRFARVIKSYANAIISSFEDPEKILEQAVLDMNDDLKKMRQATAQVLASQKQLGDKYQATEQASEDWYKRAQLALGKGDEDLAREALKRRKMFADNASALKAQLDQQKGVVVSLVSNTRLLESKIQEARSKKDTLKARANSAKTATKLSEMLANVNTSSALSAFEKMEEKVMTMESRADALNQLTTNDLDRKFALLESSLVDDDLADLKEKLSGSSNKGELPPGRTSVTSNTPFPFQDTESTLSLTKSYDAKFENEVHYDFNVTDRISYGQIGELSGVSTQDLSLWFPGRNIRVDVPGSGVICFDVDGVVFKQFSLSLSETPSDCLDAGTVDTGW